MRLLHGTVQGAVASSRLLAVVKQLTATRTPQSVHRIRMGLSMIDDLDHVPAAIEVNPRLVWLNVEDFASRVSSLLS